MQGAFRPARRDRPGLPCELWSSSMSRGSSSDTTVKPTREQRIHDFAESYECLFPGA